MFVFHQVYSLQIEKPQSEAVDSCYTVTILTITSRASAETILINVKLQEEEEEEGVYRDFLWRFMKDME